MGRERDALVVGPLAPCAPSVEMRAKRREAARRRREEARQRPAIEPFLLRPRDVAGALACSESLVNVFVRRGWLTPVRLPGIRSVRFAREDVAALAEKIRRGDLA